MFRYIQRRIIYFFKQDLYSMLFILIGGKFYLNWMLITNPTSKNFLIRRFWKNNSIFRYSSIKDRYGACFALGGIHLLIGTFFLFIDQGLLPGNVLTNLYPCLVQLYIGIRCHKILKSRQKSNALYKKSFHSIETEV